MGSKFSFLDKLTHDLSNASRVVESKGLCFLPCWDIVLIDFSKNRYVDPVFFFGPEKKLSGLGKKKKPTLFELKSNK